MYFFNLWQVKKVKKVFSTFPDIVRIVLPFDITVVVGGVLIQYYVRTRVYPSVL